MRRVGALVDPMFALSEFLLRRTTYRHARIRGFLVIEQSMEFAVRQVQWQCAYLDHRKKQALVECGAVLGTGAKMSSDQLLKGHSLVVDGKTGLCLGTLYMH
jgi:hypothetical protein